MILSPQEMKMVMNGSARWFFPSSLQNVTFREDEHHRTQKQIKINKNKMEEHIDDVTVCGVNSHTLTVGFHSFRFGWMKLRCGEETS